MSTTTATTLLATTAINFNVAMTVITAMAIAKIAIKLLIAIIMVAN